MRRLTKFEWEMTLEALCYFEVMVEDELAEGREGAERRLRAVISAAEKAGERLR